MAKEKKITVWHGSPYLFTAFDPKYMDHGVSQLGSGFYFTSSPTIARGYSELPTEKSRHLSGVEYKPTIYEAELSYQKALQADSCQQLTRHQIEKFIRAAPDMVDALNDHYDVQAIGVLAALDKVVRSYADSVHPEVPLLDYLNTINNDFYRDEPLAFSHAVKKILGYDMVISKTEYDTVFVALFPEQIEIKSMTTVLENRKSDPEPEM